MYQDFQIRIRYFVFKGTEVCEDLKNFTFLFRQTPGLY